MEITGILFLVVVLVSLTLFIFALVKAFSGWGVLYTIFLVFTFLACLTFVFATAGVASRRIAWVRIHDKLKLKADTLEEQARRLKDGDLYQPSPDLSSLLPLANELSRHTAERGRIWRGAAVAEFKPTSVSLTLAAKPPEVQVPGAPAPATSAADTNDDLPAEELVYGFSEGQGKDGKLLPKAYVGEYVVAESQNGRAVLRPVVPLSQSQIDAAKSSSTWTIFKSLPIDSHTAFAEPNSKRTNESEFGRMDEKTLSDLLNIPADLLTREPSQLSETESRQAKRLKAYVLDGSRAPENESPENVWYRIEFLAEEKVQVDVPLSADAPANVGSAANGGDFDQFGQAISAGLKRGKEKGDVVFKKGSQVLYPKIPAEQLIERGVAKLIEPIFVRPINSYSIAFNEARIQLARSLQDIELLKRQIAQVQETSKVAQERVVFRQDERQLLDKDIEQYKKELAIITSEAERLDDAVKQKKAELNQIFRTNQEQYERLVRTQQALQAIAN